MNAKILAKKISFLPCAFFYLMVSCADLDGPYNFFGAITYQDEDTEITITGLANRVAKNLTIPASIHNKPVTVIAEAAFKNTTITSVVIPNSVITIGDQAFAMAESLSEVYIANGITSIGYQAFAGTAITSVQIPNSVTSIGNEAFAMAESLSEVHIGNGITSIGSLAFAGTAITTLTILAVRAPSLAGDPTKTFTEPLSSSTLCYPIGDTDYTEAPWSNFSNKKTVLDPAVIDDINREHLNISISLKPLPGVTITLEAHTGGAFTDDLPQTVDSDPTITTSQIITFTNLRDGASYYLRARAYQDNQENPTDWIELPGSPFITRKLPIFSIERVLTDKKTIILTFKTQPGISISVQAHSNADYTYFSSVSETRFIKASGEFLEIRLSNLMTPSGKYYLRAKASNSLGERSVWVEAPDNPYFIFFSSIVDAIPRSGKIIVKVKSNQRDAQKIQISENENFTSIANEISFVSESYDKTLEINGLSNDKPYYLRTLLADGSFGSQYSTPLIPTADGKQYIHRLSELAKIGVDTENYPANWNYELKRDLKFFDADNNGVENDRFDSNDTSNDGAWEPLTPGIFNNQVYQSGGFTGSFDGKNHLIEGLLIDGLGLNRVGLFGTIAPEGEIKNLVLTNLFVQGNSEDTGGLIGYNLGSLTNSHINGFVWGEGQRTGGLVGYNKGNITASYSTGNISGMGDNTGGLVGEHASGSITDSYAACAVIGFNNVGGLVGNNKSSITGSYATGDVQGDGDNLGGLVGSNSSSITGSYATGNVQGDGGDNLGGLVGSNSSSITGSYATGEVSEGSVVGGLVGTHENGASITGSYATGDVRGTSKVGGLIGVMPYSPSAMSSTTLTDSYATGNVSGEQIVGGLIGESWATITNSYATGDVSATIDNIGGLVGVLKSEGSITNSYRYNNQTITPPDNVTPNTSGSIVTLDQLKTPSWYTSTDSSNLGWTAEDWVITGRVDGTPPYHPHISNFPGQPNTPLPTP